VLPPQYGGEVVVLGVATGVHPPLKVNPISQSSNAVCASAWLPNEQADVVELPGVWTITSGAIILITWLDVLVLPQASITV